MCVHETGGCPTSRFATGCRRLGPLCSIDAPRFVACSDYDRPRRDSGAWGCTSGSELPEASDGLEPSTPSLDSGNRFAQKVDQRVVDARVLDASGSEKKPQGAPSLAVQRASLGEVDLLLLPVGGGPTIGGGEAAALVREVGPRLVDGCCLNRKRPASLPPAAVDFLRRPPADLERSGQVGDREKPDQVLVVDHESTICRRR
jgi:hypothetical protein